ncbi:MAG: hypothetical protein UT40_C0043G0003 [Candidatus Woesebacteria bacterium GW2011_GWA1_39_21b]|uniref:Glycosyltransferase RgtA/B/C/D-like domain-containing protein n=1 Tax=Candidatus Woesebacteria bacterium GW2011_GWA1_39_21b TaxID=1618551 RepID=A0A0G0QKG7_9BACT|nr:MAG: hypothetical protein US72_C0017G0020 [Microgenomates group bacterium GW2011_GWC1_38_12]KKR10910.1 MAG: hypothetical protein UT40_C0043G0003 [Candidatus Woesebacteria bacterium GW2011_GWA1_39_21b]
MNMRRLINFLNKNYILVIIVLFAAGLRFVKIAQIPPSLNWDEVSHGYNAYSILKSGRDEWDKSFPIIFKAYGDYKLPVYIYITVISEFLFGLNAFAVRLPSVLAGIGTVIFTYLFVKELFVYRGNTLTNTQNDAERVALLSSLLAVVEPWSLFLSRGAFEANIALFFIVAGVYFFFRSFRSSNFLLLTSFLFGLSVWTYNSARIFVPLLIVTLVLLFKKELLGVFKENRQLTSYILLLTSLFFLTMFYQLLNPIGQARYGRVAIIDDGAIAQIIEARQNSSFGPLLTRLIYNRPTYFTQRFIENWGSHFTCSFLFFRGGSHYQFSVPGHGLLYLVNLPFFFSGLLILLKRVLKRDKASFFLLSWLILAPVPSSLTREAPHVLRSIVMLPIPMVLSAVGLVAVVNWLNKIRIFKNKYKILYLIYFVFLAGFVENYLNIYFNDYKRIFSWSWQYGYRQVVDYIKLDYDKYDKIIVTKKYGEPHEFLLFFLSWDPGEYRNDPNLIRFNQSNWFWVDRFDKFYFVNDWNVPKEEWQSFKLESGTSFNCIGQKCLLITSPENSPKTWSKLKTVYFLDGKVAFDLYENR